MTFPETFAEWAVALGPAGREARAEAKLSFVDTRACIAAGERTEQYAKAKRALNALGELGKSQRAFLNALAAHSQDFDDYEIPASTHPSAPLVGALLGISNNQLDVDLLDAYIVGYEAIILMGLALGYEHYTIGWHATSTIGPVGAAAACAKWLGLGTTEFAGAIAMSTSMAAGLKAQFGSDTKPLHAGLAARAGLEAAMFAAQGLSARFDVFDGHYGFTSLYGGKTSPGMRAAIAAVGGPTGILVHRPQRKQWPSCGYTHRPIEAGIRLHERIAGRQIEYLTLSIAEPYLRVAPVMNPTTPSEARFSAVYCLALAILDGSVTPESFASSAIGRADVQALLAQSTVAAYDPGPDVTDMSPDHPDTIVVTLSDGTTLSESVARVHRMSSEDIEAKHAVLSR